MAGFELAREAGSWSEDHTAGKLSSVVNRTRRAFAGERIEWRGELFDPRYRLTNQRIIEWLEIDASEESRMKTLISTDEHRRRDRQRDEDRRREAGAMSRGEYEGRAANRRSQARRMAAEGLGATEIGRRLKISRQHVYKLLRGSHG